MPPQPGGNRALRYVLREANKLGVNLSNVFVSPSKTGKPAYVKGVRKGNFVKRRIRRKEQPSHLAKLPPIGLQTVPHPLKAAPEVVLSAESSTSSTFTSRIYAWLKQNAAVLILNFGSICTLIAFTRSDVLELRAYSTVGSLSSVIYCLSLTPRRLLPVAWSSLFAAVNAFKISQILYERNAHVSLTEHEEDIYVEHFMPHGATPKQFEKIIHKSKPLFVQKGAVIVKQGDPLKNVYLVTKGQTRAQYMGRRLTAVSSAPGYREHKIGGDAGAWIGEMTFLEAYGRKQMQAEESNRKEKGATVQRRLHRSAIYTIFAETDCELLVWSHQEVQELMEESTDMRAAMTRAMTAPIVGKVINFTLSMGKKPWTSWLDDFKYSGARVNVVNKQPEEDSEVEVEPVM